jgi:hypothetical protein
MKRNRSLLIALRTAALLLAACPARPPGADGRSARNVIARSHHGAVPAVTPMGIAHANRTAPADPDRHPTPEPTPTPQSPRMYTIMRPHRARFRHRRAKID